MWHCGCQFKNDGDREGGLGSVFNVFGDISDIIYDQISPVSWLSIIRLHHANLFLTPGLNAMIIDNFRYVVY